MKRLLSLFLVLSVMFCSSVNFAFANEESAPKEIQVQENKFEEPVMDAISFDEPMEFTQVQTLSLMALSNDEAPEEVEGVYQLDSAEDLIWLSEQVNTGVGIAYNAVLLNDIDMSGVTEWTAIGGGSYNYTGIFDGGNYSIKNLAINATDTQFVGLFGKITGTIKNLTMDESCTITVHVTEAFESNIWVASMICVTRADSVIENCHNEANYTINAIGATAENAITSCAGGVLGQHSGTATNCTNSADITYTTTGPAEKTGSAMVGGVVSRNYNGDVENCSNTGEITINAEGGEKALTVYAGGVIGHASYSNGAGSIEDCTNSALVTANGVGSDGAKLTIYTGGVAGYNNCMTAECVNNGDVNADLEDGSQSAYIGGVFGYTSSNTVESCSNHASVNLSAEGCGAGNSTVSLYVSGLIGRSNNSTVSECINSEIGVVTASAENCNTSTTLYVGGVAGEQNNGMLDRCKNDAEISGSGTVDNSAPYINIGGIAGKINAANAENCENIAEVSLTAIGAVSGKLGGVAGYSESSNILGCSNSGNLLGESKDNSSATVNNNRIYVGGIVGQNYTSEEYHTHIEDSYNSGSVVVKNTVSGYAGGITGDNNSFRNDEWYAIIVNCENDGDVTQIGGRGTRFGGIAGQTNSKIYNSRNSGSVTGDSSGSYVGGIAGQMNSGAEAINCYTTGSAQNTSNDDQAHLLTPLNQGNGVSFCYALDDTVSTFTGAKFISCSTFTANQNVNYNGSADEITLVEALNIKAAEYTSETYEWRSWIIENGKNEGYPVLGDLFSDSVSETQYQTVAGGDWLTGSLSKALREVYDGGTIKLLVDIDLKAPIVLAQNVTLTSADENDIKMLTSTIDGHEALLRLRSGIVRLENIILDGGYKSDGSGVTSKEALITVEGFCTLYIDEGTQIRNNYNTVSVSANISNKSSGGINAFEECTVFMNGGEIYNNYHCVGGGVLINNDAHFILNDGSIHDNTAYINSGKGYGGGVYIYNGTLTMNNGSIVDNTAESYGGGIYQQQVLLNAQDNSVINNSFAYLYGGTITGNHADVGGAMTISGNPTWQWSGVGTWGNTVVSNMKITDNNASTRAGGIDINPGNVLHVSGYVRIEGNTCTADPILNDVVLRNTAAVIDPAGILVIDSALAEGSAIHVDTLFKEADASVVKALAAQSTDSYDITESDYEKFVCTNSDYVLFLDTDENCIWLMAPGPVVTFDTQGGSDIASVMVMPGKTVAKPADPTREGYDFVGWYTSEDGGTTLSDTEYDFETPVVADITLYAKWDELYKVTYELDGGIGADGSDYSEKYVKGGTEITVNAAPMKSGYTFNNYSDGVNEYQPGETIVVSSDLVLTAKWTQNASGGSSMPRGNITLTKVDAEDASLSLSGVVFKLYKADGTLVGTYTTDQNGQIKATGLRTGKYYFVETKAAEGYILDDTKHTVEVVRNKTIELSVTNKKSDSGNTDPVYTPGVFRTEHIAYVSGYDDNTVRPEAEITRAEVATIFYRLLNDETREKYFSSENNFSDVDDDSWYNEAVSTMFNMGVIRGYPSGEFKPNEKITRAEFAVIAARFDDRETAVKDYRFEDMKGHWAKSEVARAVANGWVLGYEDNTFRAENNITRAEAITLINRVLQRVPESKEDLLDEMIVWVDNADENQWYYLAVQEATNSHEYSRKANGYEKWVK